MATIVDPRFKVEHISLDEHKFISTTLLDFIDLENVVEASSTNPIDYLTHS